MGLIGGSNGGMGLLGEPEAVDVSGAQFGMSRFEVAVPMVRENTSGSLISHLLADQIASLKSD